MMKSEMDIEVIEFIESMLEEDREILEILS